MEFDICKGIICQGNHMESGHYIAYYSWDEHHLGKFPIKELWVFDSQGKRVCYFDPVGHKEWFSIYHDFDSVIGANISQSWLDDNKINISVAGADGTQISVEIDVAQWHKWEGESFEGVTETGKKYCNRPDQLGICSSVKVLLDEQDLGKAITPTNPVYLGSAPVPEQAIINRCIHELEP